MHDPQPPIWPQFASALLRRAAATAVAADAELCTRLDDEIDRLRRAFARELPGTGDFAALVANARLDVSSAEVFAVVCAYEFDPVAEVLARALAGGAGALRLTFGELAKVLPPPHPAARTLGPGGAMRRARIVEVEGDGPWRTLTVRLAPDVAWALAGDVSKDSALPYGARLLDPWPGERTAADAAVGAVGAVGAVEAVEPTAAGILSLVTGEDRVRRRQLARALLGGRRVLMVDEPADGHAWDAVVREATLAGAAVLVELDGGLSALGRRTITDASHLDWAVSTRNELPIESLPQLAWRDEHAADGEVTEADWAEVFDAAVPRRHRLSAERLERVQRAVAATGGDVDRAVRRLASGKIDALAKRIRPRRAWADLVLAGDRAEHLHELVARYRHRAVVHDDWGFGSHPSAGLVALFAGPSGTGKTLSAEVVAAELGLDLFTVSLASVVSKYIGETEQNLEEVFEAASHGELVLFFDEADSLFAKRSEVNDSRDRYANLETSYLLQRLERHDGLVILATNLQNNIDSAFLRRIDLSIEFLAPDVAERERLWRQSFPAGAPLHANVDIDDLAQRYELTGGSIRKAALHAAFLAADAASPITAAVVLAAIRREYQKLGRLLPT